MLNSTSLVSTVLFLFSDAASKNREETIHKKIEKLSVEKGLDVDIIDQIVDMLTILNKNEQEKILKEEC